MLKSSIEPFINFHLTILIFKLKRLFDITNSRRADLKLVTAILMEWKVIYECLVRILFE